MRPGKNIRWFSAFPVRKRDHNILEGSQWAQKGAIDAAKNHRDQNNERQAGEKKSGWLCDAPDQGGYQLKGRQEAGKKDGQLLSPQKQQDKPDQYNTGDDLTEYYQCSRRLAGYPVRSGNFSSLP